MSDEELAEKDLSRIFARGIADGAQKLTRLSRAQWNVRAVSVKMAPLERFQYSAALDETEQYGSYLTIPGGVFIVMFPVLVTAPLADAFLPPEQFRRSIVADRERVVIAEISNIVANTLANDIADACGVTFFLSAPKTLKGKKKELFAAAPMTFAPSEEKFTVMADAQISSVGFAAECSISLLLNPAWKNRLLRALSS